MNIPVNFHTQRLAAERLRQEHFELIFRMHQDEEVMAYLGGKRSRRQTKEYMARNLAHWDEHGYGIWILREISTGVFAGRGGLRNAVLGDHDEVEIAYGLLPQFWNRGLATEFVQSVLRIGLSEIGLSRLACITHPDNIASQRVLEKTDFQYEGIVDFEGRTHLLYAYSKR